MLKLVEPDASVPPSESGGPREPRYWAFLSYSHHDKLIAKRLQRQLETYRVPRRLVGRETSAGPVPARATPVFRDRDELHAGADLKASVQDALSRSRWLIVVCTPDSARSPWVNREIIEFKRLHGERHVLALIARGEPFASDMPGREAEECFPPALRRALTPDGAAEGEPLEPIAADMRKHGDGPQRAVLKLLAGMLGVGFDDLVRRDLQRRVRLLSALAGASVLGVVVLAFLAVLAVQARNEAQHQRMQAEGLIEFMLGDLRKKLEPVGRLEVLDSVGEKALAYYGSQEASRLDATALGHRSRAMHLIGEIRDLRGKPAEAQEAFEQAAATTAQLLAQAPKDGRRVFDHAQSVFWVGDAAWKRGDIKAAEAKFQEYLELAHRLDEIDRTNVDWRAEVAFAQIQLGMVRLESGRPAEALKSLRLAGSALNELIPARPALSFELTQTQAWSADAYELLGDYERALEEQRHRLSLFRDMPNAEKDRTVQRNILNALDTVAKYQLALGRVAEAEVSIRAALQIAEELTNADPKNIYWLGDACIAMLTQAEVESVFPRRADARATLGRASECIAQANAAGSLGPSFSVKAGTRSIALTASLSEGAGSEGFVGESAEFVKRSMARLAPDTPNRTKVVTDLANAAIALGEMLAKRDPRVAHEMWSNAESLLASQVDSNNGAVLTPLARARYHLGDVSGAQALAARIQRSSYRHPAYVGIAKQLQTVRGGGRATAITLEKS